MTSSTIIRGVGGFYYVRDDAGQIVRCRARGLFRLQGLVPMVGDKVTVKKEENGDDVIAEIMPRSHVLKRPPVANASQGIIVSAVKEPDISYVLLDKMLAANIKAGIKSIICFNKTDLASDAEMQAVREIYENSDAGVFFVSAAQEEGTEELEEELKGKITVFSGVSGSGKTSIISLLCPDLNLETGAVSRRTLRGRNTTRRCEIYVSRNGSYVIDTPGFSSLTLDMKAEDLWSCYKDFYEYSDCRYSDCVHINEPDCNVKKAVSDGLINSVRYESYKEIYEELKRTQNR